MKVYVTKTSFLGVILALGLIGGVRQVAPAQTPAVTDNQVQMVTYFPVPAVSYGNIYIGKKLDIGIGRAFDVTLGDTSCGHGSNKLVTEATGKLPSIWTINPAPGEAGTPIFLRYGSFLKLNFSSPVLVKEISLGQQFASSGSSKIINMGPATLTFYKLQLGKNDLNPTIESMTANIESMDTYAKYNTRTSSINFPQCESGPAQWRTGKFNNTSYTFLACGGEPEAFASSVACQGESGKFTWCRPGTTDPENPQYACDTSTCTNQHKWVWGNRTISVQRKAFCLGTNNGESEEKILTYLRNNFSSQMPPADCPEGPSNGFASSASSYCGSFEWEKPLKGISTKTSGPCSEADRDKTDSVEVAVWIRYYTQPLNYTCGGDC